MKHSEKVAAVEKMNAEFQATPHVILATFQGLKVNQANSLRSKIRGMGGGYKVIKNRLAKRAAAGTPVAELAPRMTGPCAVATHASDPVALAKVLSDFGKENPELKLLGGVVDARDVLDAAGVKQLATLPGLPELRAQLLSVVQAPATRLVRLLGTPGGQLARALDARREKLGGQG